MRLGLFINRTYAIKYSKIKKYDIILYPKDITCISSLFLKFNLKPETFDEIDVFHVLDKSLKIRLIIKELDVLLRKEGVFRIISSMSLSGKNLNHANYFRSKSQIKSEFSLSTFGRYNLIYEKHNGFKSFFEYKKRLNTLSLNDSIDKWSFGIITNGAKMSQVEALIDSIIIQKIPNFEIIVCGPHKTTKSNVKIISDVKSMDTRAPINTKKNKLISNFNFENIVLLHDRFIFPENWFLKMKNYGNYFEVLQIPNLDKNLNRVNDWIYYKGLPNTLKFMVNGSLPYDTLSNHTVIPGGLYLGKKKFFKLFPLLNYLHWDEMEDIVFSKNLHLNGVLFKIDRNNYVFTNSDRLSSKKRFPSFFSIPIKYLRWIFANIKNRIIYQINILKP